MGRLILNCDLGENESDAATEALTACIDAANICCGVHAGNLDKTRRTLQIAKAYGARVGAHPGMAEDGGRGRRLPHAVEFLDLLNQQFSQFMRLANEECVAVSYVKLHGSLYHAVEESLELREVYLDWIQTLQARPVIVCLAGGATAKTAKSRRLAVYEELFADRAYRTDGSLVPRHVLGSVLRDPEKVAHRIAAWLRNKMIETIEGTSIHLPADTLCVHSDSDNALKILRALKDQLDRS